MSTALIILAKAPRAGLVKTRLIPALGADGAAALAERLLEHTVAAGQQAGFDALELCVAPDAGHPSVARLGAQPGVALALQGEGDLGQRMQRALQRALARHDAALLVGTDAPALDAPRLRAAAAALAHHDAVFVPALDGGYALVGLRRSAAAAALGPLFEGLPWSTPQVMALTRERAAAARLHTAELEPVADIDEPADLVHLPPALSGAGAAAAPAAPPGEPSTAAPPGAPPRAGAPGRSCPLDYRYAPAVFAGEAPAALRQLDLLYVVGGLYGNELALEQTLRLFERERRALGPRGRAALVFNGDFHWFDRDPAAFARIQRTVLAHHALRGNVETELARAEPAGAGAAGDSGALAAGCGCAYPEWVGDEVVERSNRILHALRGATTAQQRRELAALPMWQRADVGGLRLGIVHGDAQSLAGWGFAQEHLADAQHRRHVAGWFDAAEVHAFASTHTCLPVFQRLGAANAANAANAASATAPLRWIFNNGAAGMPNFAGDTAGLLTRVALRPYPNRPANHPDDHPDDHPARGLEADPATVQTSAAGVRSERRFGVVLHPAGAAGAPVYVDAIAIDTDAAEAERRFLALWPAGSDAHASYHRRIAAGPTYEPAAALRLED